MNCKFHPNTEPIALCKNCDCGICKSCMAFADFSGLCPYCYLDSLKEKARNYKIGKIILAVFASIFLLATILFTILGSVLYSIYHDVSMLTFFTYVAIFGVLFILFCVFSGMLAKKQKAALHLLEQKKKQLINL